MGYEDIKVGRIYRARYGNKYIIIVDKNKNKSSYKYSYVGALHNVIEIPYTEKDTFHYCWELVNG